MFGGPSVQTCNSVGLQRTRAPDFIFITTIATTINYRQIRHYPLALVIDPYSTWRWHLWVCAAGVVEWGEDEAVDSSNNQDFTGKGGHLGGSTGEEVASGVMADRVLIYTERLQ